MDTFRWWLYIRCPRKERRATRLSFWAESCFDHCMHEISISSKSAALFRPNQPQKPPRLYSRRKNKIPKIDCKQVITRKSERSLGQVEGIREKWARCGHWPYPKNYTVSQGFFGNIAFCAYRFIVITMVRWYEAYSHLIPNENDQIGNFLNGDWFPGRGNANALSWTIHWPSQLPGCQGVAIRGSSHGGAYKTFFIWWPRTAISYRRPATLSSWSPKSPDRPSYPTFGAMPRFPLPRILGSPHSSTLFMLMEHDAGNSEVVNYL